MNRKKLYTDKRWTEPPIGTILSNRSLTEAEKKEADEFGMAVEKGKLSEWFNKIHELE